MAAAAISKNQKNGQISANVRPIAEKFGTMMHFDPLYDTLSAKRLKIQYDRRLSTLELKNRNIWVTV